MYKPQWRYWYDRLPGWMKSRLSRQRPDGFILSVGVIFASLCILGFVSIAEDVLTYDDLAQLDQSILNAIYQFRSDGATTIFRFVTNLAGLESVAAGLLVLGLFAWQQRLLAVLFGSAVLVAVAVTQLLKLTFGRLRPEEALRLVTENGFSFPSGHTFLATVLFGLGGYVLFRTAQSHGAKVWAVLVAGLLIGLVGLSRMYLGVHYPSDVAASLLFASAVGCIGITLVEINQRFELRRRLLLSGEVRKPLSVALAVMLTVSGVLTALH